MADRTDNILTNVFFAVDAYMTQVREKARAARTTTFMHRDVKPSEMLRQAQNMTPAERRQLDRDTVLKALRNRKDDA